MKKVILLAFAKRSSVPRKFSAILAFIMLGFNLNGQNIETFVVETWTGSAWENSSRTAYTYDGNHYLTNTLSQTWDVPTLSWTDVSQSIFTNNPDGTANQVVTQMWDGVSDWNNISRVTYTYNASKKVLTYTSELWFGIAWQNSSKVTDVYDGNGFLTTSTTQTWDIISSTWKNSSLVTYTNFVNGTVNYEISQLWDGVSAWTNSRKSTFTYNGSNKVLTEVTEEWMDPDWQSYSKETNTYDGNGFLILTLEQLWDMGSTSWKDDSRMNYTNNTDGTPSVVVSQSWDGVSTWDNVQRSTYTYSTATLIRKTTGEDSFTVYPNPAGDAIRIKGTLSMQGTAYSITDQKGKVLINGKLLNDDRTIDLSSLSNGIYFLNFGLNSHQSCKIIKNQLR